MCVIGSTDDMVFVLVNHVFMLVCVLACHADKHSVRCADTHQHTREKNQVISCNDYTGMCVCVCVCVCVCECVWVCLFIQRLRERQSI